MRVFRHRCTICGVRTRAVTFVGTGPSEPIGLGSGEWVCSRHAPLDDHRLAARAVFNTRSSCAERRAGVESRS